MVHFYRNVFSVVPTTKVREVAAMLKAIHAAEDREAATAKAAQVAEKLSQMKLEKAAQKVRASIMETLTYYSFPETHWRRIRTNNPLERLLREVRRRTRVVGAFPDGEAALMLTSARGAACGRNRLGDEAISFDGSALQADGIERSMKH